MRVSPRAAIPACGLKHVVVREADGSEGEERAGDRMRGEFLRLRVRNGIS